MVKLKINLGEETNIEAAEEEKLKELAAPLPSPKKAEDYSLRRAERVQFAFSNVPRPIKEAFAKEAKKRKITQKELLYICLRKCGIEIPEYLAIDARRR